MEAIKKRKGEDSSYLLIILVMSICHPPRDNDVMPLLIGQIILEGKTISRRNFDHRLNLLKIALF